MRLLIDECVDERLRFLFPAHECQTAFCKSGGIEKTGVFWMLRNRVALDVLLTVDQNIPEQQNLAGRKIALLILCGPTNRLRDLVGLVPATVSALASIKQGDVVRIRDSGGVRWGGTSAGPA